MTDSEFLMLFFFYLEYCSFFLFATVFNTKGTQNKIFLKLRMIIQMIIFNSLI